MFYYKDPEATTFALHFHNSTDFSYYTVDFDTNTLSIAFLITSAAVAMFATMTTQLQEGQMIDNIVEYNEELSNHLFTWNATQYFIIAVVRVHVIAILCSPMDIYMLWLIVALQTYAIVQLLIPRPNYNRIDSFPCILFVMVVFFVFNCMHNKHGLRLVFWAMLAIADLLLIVGHTYDSQKNTETIANCRIFYNCCISGIQILLYTSV
jgi:hypothetical protein